MRRLSFLAAVLAIAVAGPASPPRPRPAPAPATAVARDVLAALPVAFEPAGDAGFVSRGPGYSVALSPAEAVVVLRDATFLLRPAGPTANASPTLVPGEPLPGTVTRLTGDDPALWTTGVSTFGRVEARQVWPGVDMVWHGDQRRLEHDVVVAPGADPAVVALDVEGARALTVDPQGDLVLDLGGTSARLARPVVYQEVAGARRSVAGGFSLLGPSRIGFRVGAYDAGLPLVIDPTLVTSTFLGGTGNDSGYGIVVDPEGNTYVTGATESADFLTTAPLQQTLNGTGGQTSDVFVSKFSPDGSRLIWSTYMGGRGRDTGYGVAVATDGSVYVTGVTESPDFPIARAAQSGYGGGPSDAFVARIAANGTGIEWSTFVGGGGIDRGRGLVVDSAGNAYVTGTTGSADFRSVNPQQPGPFRPDDLDAFLVKLPSAGAPFTFATRLGGGNDDRGLAVALDTQNNIYVTGDTLSPGFPTVKPIQATSGGSAGGVAGSFTDAFVSKYNTNGSALIYSTFLGGSDLDQGTAIAVDSQGAAYVAGNTNSPNFPTVGPLQATKGNDSDAFAVKIDPAGGALVYSTYFGGSGADGANAIAVDRTGSAHIVGATASANWATAKPVQPVKSGGEDAFILRLDSTGRGPLFSTFLGGKDSDAGMGVALDGQGGLHVVGLSGSSDLPSVKPVQGVRPPAGGDAFLASYNLVDAAAPATTADAAAAPAPASSSSAHDRRVRVLLGLTVALLLVAVAQTFFLRRRSPAVATVGRPSRPTQPSGVQGVGGAKKAGASAKAHLPPRSNRAPKARGGPKSGGPKAGGPKAGGVKKVAGVQRIDSAPLVQGKGPAVEPDPLPADDAGEATEAVSIIGDDGETPTVATPPPRRVRPHEPAIAQLLEEDFWAPDPDGDEVTSLDEVADAEPAATAGDAEAPPAPVPAALAPPAPEWAPFDTGSTPVVGAAPPPEPGVPIPPVPAEELSFWDLFPEDLPPARATAFPAEDMLIDPLALPEGPDSVAGRLTGQVADDGPTVAAAAPAPQQSPESEIVIAELLDGPLPTGIRQPADAMWAPQAPGDDFVVDDLLIDRGPSQSEGQNGNGDTPDEDDDDDDLAAATQGRSPEEQARVAADRARRRRSRRGGRRRPPSDG